MEPINTNVSNSDFEEVIDDRLEKVVQEFNEFREKMARSSSNGGMKLEDLIDLYINKGGENSCNTPQNTREHISTLPEHGFDIDREIQESEMMTQKMTEETRQNDTESFLDKSQPVNINSHLGAASSSSIRVTRVRHGDLNCSEAADGIIGSVFGGSTETAFGSVMRFFRIPSASVKENGEGTTARKRVKRKYRRVTQTEEETAREVEITKINNKEAAAKAHAN